MIMDEVLSRIVEGCPVAVMARLGLDHVLDQKWVNETFEKHREEQYTRELLFSTVVDMMGLVATGQRPSLRRPKKKMLKLTRQVTLISHQQVNTASHGRGC